MRSDPDGQRAPEQLAWTWTQQGAWSRAADRLKQRIDRVRRAALLLGIAAAVLAVTADQLGGVSAPVGRVLSAGAAAAAGLATVLQRRVGIKQISDWTRARSAAEGLKSEVYSYLAGGSSYAGVDRDQRLGVAARGIVEGAADVQRQLLGVSAERRDVPPVSDVASYLTHRVDGQIHRYYRPRAARYERRVRRLRALADVLGVGAVVLAGLAAALEIGGLAVWVPVVTTIGTSIAAYVAASRYDQLVVEYLRTAQRLEHLRQGHLEDPGADPAAFVDACEAAISVENQAWMARWDPPDETVPAAG